MKLHLPLSLLVNVCVVSVALAGVGDTGSTWDPNWGESGLEGAPDASAPQYQANITSAGVTALVRPEGTDAPYDFGTYTAITLVGAGNDAALIIGGASATESDTTGSVVRNTWIAAEEGEYSLLVGGNYADNWKQGSVFNFTGNSHILLHGADVANIIGGNYKDAQSAAFSGNSYISVMSGNVSGAIVGAGVVTHNRDVQFTGDTHIFIYTPLADNSGEAINLLPVNMVMGGFGWATNTWKTQSLTGDTHVTVDLSNYTGTDVTFSKHIVGGGFNGASGNTQLIDGDTNVSVDLGKQSLADNVRVVGGHWVNAGAASVTGTSYLSITEGVFPDWVVGGSWTDVSNTTTSHGAIQMQLNGGTFNGNVAGATRLAAGVGVAEVGAVHVELSGARLNGTLYGGFYVNGTGTDAFSASLGDVNLVLDGAMVNNIIGGSYVPRNNADTVLQQGNITVDLQSGVVAGNVHAAGQQLGSSSMQTQSVTVNIGAAVEFGATSVVSGGYAGTSVSSSVLGARKLVFTDAQDYTHSSTLNAQNFDEVQVVAGGEVALASLTGSPVLLKSGGGDLTLGAHTSLSELTVDGGTVALQSGQDATELTELMMAADTSVSGLKGTLSTANTVLSLSLAPQNIGENVAAVPMLNGTDFILSIESADNVTLDLSADAVVSLLEAHRDADSVSWLTLTNGTLQFDTDAETAIIPDLWSYGIRVSGVSGGSLLLSGQAQGLYYVTADATTTDPHLVTTYPTLGMFEGVVIEGGQSLTLSLPGDESEATRATVRNLVGGSESSLVVQNSASSGMVEVVLEQSSDTMMGGSITADDTTKLIKTGAAMLTVQGAFSVPDVEVQQGALVLEGQGNELRSIQGGASLTLAGSSQTTFTFNTDTAEKIIDLASLVIESGAELTLYSTGLQYLDVGEYVLGEVDALSAGDYHLTLNGTPFLRADAALSYLSLEDGRLSLFLVANNENSMANVATSHNSLAGATLLWNSALSAGGSAQTAFNEVMRCIRVGDARAANELMAAVAGASYAAPGMAFQHEIRQRLYAIRNRTTHMSLPDCFVYEDIPYINAWVNADGAYSELSASGTESGYRLSSWGGTVGMDAAFNDAWSAGIAFTALYGDFDADSPDYLSGDFDTYSVSLFALYEKCGWTHTLIGTGSWLQSRLDRRVQAGAVDYSTSADTHGFGVGLLYELGYKFCFNEQQSCYLQPLAQVLYSYTGVSGFAENGSDAALRVGKQSQNSLVFGLGLRGQTPIGETVDDRMGTLQGRALLKVYALDRRGEVDVAFVDSSVSASVISASEGVLGAEIGAGLDIPIGVGTGVLYLDASAEFRAHAVDVFGSVGYRFRF